MCAPRLACFRVEIHFKFYLILFSIHHSFEPCSHSDRGAAGARAVGASDDDGGAGASYGVVDHSPTASAAPEWQSTPCFRSDFSGWRDADLYPLAAPRAAPDQTITRSFRAGLRTRAVFLRARRTRSSRRRRARRFLFSACRIGAPLELGRWGRAMMMVVPAPATGSSTTARPHPQHPNGSTPCFRSDFSGWRDADLYAFGGAARRAGPNNNKELPSRVTHARRVFTREADPLEPPSARSPISF